jgi:outer membrane protein OmpA-like peptidoglycan-associated protein
MVMRLSKLFVFILLQFSGIIGFSQVTDTLKIYYGINSSELEEAWKNEIDNMIKNDINEVKIYSYTDFLGSKSHNNLLSQQRANQVKNYLISKGIEPSLIKECKGMGIHPFSAYENRRNPEDRGILQHRVSHVVYIFDNKAQAPDVVEEKIINENKNDEQEVIPALSNLNDEKLIVGENIVLDNILFVGGTPYFKSGSETTLRHLFLAMKNNPSLVIEIQGHICCQYDGRDGWDIINQNDFLSENRAKAVYDYLVNAGIDEDRMTYVGFGSKYKLYPKEKNAFEEDQNRRVEIKIIEK